MRRRRGKEAGRRRAGTATGESYCMITSTRDERICQGVPERDGRVGTIIMEVYAQTPTRYPWDILACDLVLVPYSIVQVISILGIESHRLHHLGQYLRHTHLMHFPLPAPS